MSHDVRSWVLVRSRFVVLVVVSRLRLAGLFSVVIGDLSASCSLEVLLSLSGNMFGLASRFWSCFLPVEMNVVKREFF